MSDFCGGAFSGLKKNHYSVILADPPWSYLTYSGASVPQRAATQHYDVMDIAALRKLPVADLAAKDCALVMWVIGSHLDQAIELGRAWGFTYKSDLFTWVKVGKNDPTVRPISLGKWTRKQVEQALLFTKGNPKRLDAGVRQLIETDDQIIFEPKREHSRKPDEARVRLQRLIDGPYIELFSRESAAGWDAWGNETSKFNDPLMHHGEFDDILG